MDYSRNKKHIKKSEQELIYRDIAPIDCGDSVEALSADTRAKGITAV